MPADSHKDRFDETPLDAILAAVALVAGMLAVTSAVVHGSTFFGVDPMQRFPYVMWIHLLVVVVCFAAFFAVGRCIPSKRDAGQVLWRFTPRWLQLLTTIAGGYAAINFVLFIVLSEGGGPDQRGDKFFLTDHGRVIRKLTEQEFHQHQAYVARGFSGHWLLFSLVALLMAVGARRYRRRSDGRPLAADDELAQLARTANPPHERSLELVSRRTAIFYLIAYIGTVVMILTGQPAFAVLAAIVAAASSVRALRLIDRPPRKPFETGLGCLSIVPNALLASFMGRLVAEFLYVAWYAGLFAAIVSEVQMQFPDEGPYQLSTGEPVHTRVWSALMILVQFPLFAFGSIGLTCLLDSAARYVKSVSSTSRPHTM